MGYLDVREAKWTEMVNGGATFSGKVTVPDNPIVANAIRTNTRPYEAAIYATPGSGRINFGGPIVARSWNGDTNTLTITAIDWKSWYYRVILGPKTSGIDAWTVSYSDYELLWIAADVVYRGSADYNPGSPVIEVAAYNTGILQDYVLTGVEFKTMGAHLDALGSLANNGYEWEVEPYYAADGYPIQRVQFYRPQRGGVVNGLLFNKTPKGGNILSIEDVTDDATSMANRIWAVGEGPNAESTPWAFDEDPAMDGNPSSPLLATQVTQYTGSLTRAQLASYARAERLYRSNYLSSVTFSVRMDSPDINSYGKGDRCRIIVQDRWLDVDARNCRILSREMDPDNNTVRLTVNMNDLKLPEVDTGGSV